MSTSDRMPVEPRLAATLLVVRDGPFEVLMIRRNSRGAFASALAFPGGVVEEGDRSEAWLSLIEGADGLDAYERTLRIAAIRETFEETSMLLAETAAGLTPSIGAGPHGSFLELVQKFDLKLRLDRLVPFAHWITPEPAPQRFDTHFYIAKAPHGGTAVSDGVETVGLEWANPQDVLARARGGERSVVFPTRLNLQRLAESSDGVSALAAAAQRPRFTVLPKVEKREGGIAVVIPAEAGYSETEEFRRKEK